MKDIDWSKAPVGYPVWIESLTSEPSGWHRDDGDRYMAADQCYWTKPGEGFYVVHNRPVTPQWNGTDLPPVGAVCEVSLPYCNPEEWREITLRYVSTEYVVATIDGSEYAYSRAEFDNLYDTFRPIRTPEQIAVEEREVAVQSMQAILCRLPAGTRLGAETLYDTGYRITAEDER